jgi:hypothetical protein
MKSCSVFANQSALDHGEVQDAAPWSLPHLVGEFVSSENLGVGGDALALPILSLMRRVPPGPAS